jgi:hypothetical protein
MELSISSSTKDFKIEASKFLFRKVFETKLSKQKSLAEATAYMDKLSKPSFPIIDAMIAINEFCDWFADGKWDSRYEHYCERVALSRSACIERSREEGGAREEMARQRISQEEFWQFVIDGSVRDIPPTREVKILIDSGKVRIITVASALQSQLLPLHLLLYDACKRKDFILVGDPAPSKFSKINKSGSITGLTYEKGKVLVSGDYEAATDNFNACHSQHLVERLSERSENVPPQVWNLLKESLVGRVRYCPTLNPDDDIEMDQTSGQMMGNYCSFPLLCMMNLCTLFLTFGAKKAIEMVEKKEVKINGDDIVFKTTRLGFEQWAHAVEKLGLVLSRGKTMVHERFWSINSHFFRSTRRIKGNGIVHVPVVRSTCLFGPPRDARCPPYKHDRILGQGMWGRLESFIEGTQLHTKKKAAFAFACQNKRASNNLPFYGGKKVKKVIDQQCLAARQAFREFERAPAMFSRKPLKTQQVRTLRCGTSRGFQKAEIRGLRQQANVFQRFKDWDARPDNDVEPVFIQPIKVKNSGGALFNLMSRLVHNPEPLRTGCFSPWKSQQAVRGPDALARKEEVLEGPAEWVDLYDNKGILQTPINFIKQKHT